MRHEQKKQKILVIDDDADFAASMKESLEFRGYKVCMLNPGADPVESIRRTGPDLILLDLMMPGASGVTVLNIVKSHPLTSSIPLIVMTAMADSLKIKGDLMALGADSFVTKPCDLDFLSGEIRRFFPKDKNFESGMGRDF